MCIRDRVRMRLGLFERDHRFNLHVSTVNRICISERQEFEFPACALAWCSFVFLKIISISGSEERVFPLVLCHCWGSYVLAKLSGITLILVMKKCETRYINPTPWLQNPRDVATQVQDDPSTSQLGYLGEIARQSLWGGSFFLRLLWQSALK